MEGAYLITNGDSTSLFGFALPNACGGGKGSCEGAVKRTWRGKNRGAEMSTAFRQLQREVTMAGHIPGGESCSSQS